MKTMVKMTALSLGLALATGFASAQENIAFINAGYLFQHHPDRQALADQLDAEFKPKADQLAADKKDIDGKIAAAKKKIDDRVAALQKDAKDPKKRPSELQKREAEINKLAQTEEANINKLMQEHDKKVQAFQIENEKRQEEARAKILESIQAATNKLAKEKGYTYVIDANSVVFAVEGKDITDAVLKSIPATEKSPAKSDEKK